MSLLAKASRYIGTSIGHYIINPRVKHIKGLMPYIANVLRKFSIVVSAVRGSVVWLIMPL